MNRIEKTIAKNIGYYIKQLRKGRYSQIELAKEIGVSQSTIAQLESGRKLPGVYNLYLLEKALGSIWGHGNE